jgi:hypothetical protein
MSKQALGQQAQPLPAVVKAAQARALALQPLRELHRQCAGPGLVGVERLRETGEQKNQLCQIAAGQEHCFGAPSGTGFHR